MTRGNLTRSPALSLGIGQDRLDAGDRFLMGREWKNATPRGDHMREAGILDNDGTAGRQVSRASLAEPTRPSGYIAVLGHAELGP